MAHAELDLPDGAEDDRRGARIGGGRAAVGVVFVGPSVALSGREAARVPEPGFGQVFFCVWGSCSCLRPGHVARAPRLLEHDPHLSQRQLAQELAISVGKVNFLLKGLAEKGLVKFSNFQPLSLLTHLTAHDAPLAIIGLGYVGLPLAVEFGQHRPVIGFDIKPERIAEFQAGHDNPGDHPGDPHHRHTQRDLNIALMNERALIFGKLGFSAAVEAQAVDAGARRLLPSREEPLKDCRGERLRDPDPHPRALNHRHGR